MPKPISTISYEHDLYELHGSRNSRTALALFWFPYQEAAVSTDELRFFQLRKTALQSSLAGLAIDVNVAFIRNGVADPLDPRHRLPDIVPQYDPEQKLALITSRLPPKMMPKLHSNYGKALVESGLPCPTYLDIHWALIRERMEECAGEIVRIFSDAMLPRAPLPATPTDSE